mmetsp:Transcript_10771/g.23870  ORF Transcript_10771/g.23870 Transcript_10771/m.23870 type:complete len:168 (-) Transcript_10771:141-644(-)
MCLPSPTEMFYQDDEEMNLCILQNLSFAMLFSIHKFSFCCSLLSIAQVAFGCQVINLCFIFPRNNRRSNLDNHSSKVTIALQLVFIFLLIFLRLPVQLKRIPNSRSLNFISRSQTIRDCINRGLYGSVNEHGGCRIERGSAVCGLSHGDGGNGVIRSLDWRRRDKGF